MTRNNVVPLHASQTKVRKPRRRPRVERLRQLLPPVLAYHNRNAKDYPGGYPTPSITFIGQSSIMTSVFEPLPGAVPSKHLRICISDGLIGGQVLSLRFPPGSDGDCDVEEIEILSWKRGPWEDYLFKFCTAERSNDDD